MSNESYLRSAFEPSHFENATEVNTNGPSQNMLEDFAKI